MGKPTTLGPNKERTVPRCQPARASYGQLGLVPLPPPREGVGLESPFIYKLLPVPDFLR